MKLAPLIRLPNGKGWRAFRIQFFPIFVFVVCLGGIFHLWREHVVPSIVSASSPVEALVVKPETSGGTNLLVSASTDDKQPSTH